MESFDIFLKNHLTVAIYENLAKILTPEGETEKSPHRITKIKTNPAIMDQFELIAMAKLLKMSPGWLVDHFDAATLGVPGKLLKLIVETSEAAQASLTASPDA